MLDLSSFESIGWPDSFSSSLWISHGGPDVRMTVDIFVDFIVRAFDDAAVGRRWTKAFWAIDSLSITRSEKFNLLQ